MFPLKLNSTTKLIEIKNRIAVKTHLLFLLIASTACIAQDKKEPSKIKYDKFCECKNQQWYIHPSIVSVGGGFGQTIANNAVINLPNAGNYKFEGWYVCNTIKQPCVRYKVHITRANIVIFTGTIEALPNLYLGHIQKFQAHSSYKVSIKPYCGNNECIVAQCSITLIVP